MEQSGYRPRCDADDDGEQTKLLRKALIGVAADVGLLAISAAVHQLRSSVRIMSSGTPTTISPIRRTHMSSRTMIIGDGASKKNIPSANMKVAAIGAADVGRTGKLEPAHRE